MLASSGSRSNSLRCASLRQSRALIRWPLALLGAYRGMGSQTAEQPPRAIASLGPLLWAQAPAQGAALLGSSAATTRMAVWLFTPAGCACGGRLRGGTRVGAPVLRDLTRRGCPSGAAQQQSEFHGAPATAPPQVCPVAQRRGRRLGSPFLPSFLGDARKRCAAGRTSRHRPGRAKACSQKNGDESGILSIQ